MHLEEFSEGRSIFHRLDPRVKILVCLPLVFIIALNESVLACGVALVMSLIAVIIAQVNAKALISRLRIVNTFILLLWLTLPFNIDGQELFAIGAFHCSQPGVLFTFKLTLKANAIVLWTIALLGTTEIFALAHALAHLKMPKKLVYLFFFFYRYITVLHKEFDRLFAAVKLRGFVPHSSRHTLRTYSCLIGMLFIRSYERSERIYQALILRGFRGDFPLISHFHLHGYDKTFAGIMSLIIILLLVL